MPGNKKKDTLPVGPFIKPFTDFGFKKLFGSEPNKDLLIDFLNELLRQHQVQISKLTYKRTDHLGNTRLTIADTAGRGVAVVLQNTHYYPFGMSIATLSHTTAGHANPWLYNGKEHQPDFDLGWYDYGARFYDAEVGRFTGVDPIIEKFYYLTPYNYASNNPITNIDLWGLQGINANLIFR